MVKIIAYESACFWKLEFEVGPWRSMHRMHSRKLIISSFETKDLSSSAEGQVAQRKDWESRMFLKVELAWSLSRHSQHLVRRLLLFGIKSEHPLCLLLLLVCWFYTLRCLLILHSPLFADFTLSLLCFSIFGYPQFHRLPRIRNLSPHGIDIQLSPHSVYERYQCLFYPGFVPTVN